MVLKPGPKELLYQQDLISVKEIKRILLVIDQDSSKNEYALLESVAQHNKAQ
ncbi:hypothetical protein SAMN05421820_102564 [Pedobacter steynii]|uniref:Uncharacterized protein n=1 Tax=Pedobacter steynii TaxID=430522 RepID=A0A1G9P6T4_9SPHI|nr:hypothetical protein SAMN05421820_102564 [Pedobacter steynii]